MGERLGSLQTPALSKVKIDMGGDERFGTRDREACEGAVTCKLHKNSYTPVASQRSSDDDCGTHPKYYNYYDGLLEEMDATSILSLDLHVLGG